MKIVFMGTPVFAADVLSILVSEGYSISAVFCQPDRAGNRNKTIECPAAAKASQLGIPVYKFAKVSVEGMDCLKEIAPDLIITAAFGQMLSDEVLALPGYGVINLHGSLLPSYRGASPVQSALIDGKKLNGVTVMKTVGKMDAGDILGYRIIGIGRDDTATDVFSLFAKEGGKLLSEVIVGLEEGTIVSIPQNRMKYRTGNSSFVKPSYCRKLTKEDEIIDWSQSAVKVHNRIRGLSENPCAHTTLRGSVLKIFRSRIAGRSGKHENPGEVLSADRNGVIVACGRGEIYLSEMCLSGCKRMKCRDFVNGKKICAGDVLGAEE